MQRFWILLLLSISSTSYGKTCFHSEQSFSCAKYIKNYDADTVTFSIPNVHPIIGKDISIRVAGVDTPELRSKNSCEKSLAKKAKEFVASELSKAKRINLLNISRGKYFRIVADVEYDGKSLTKKLIDMNFGYAYHGATKRKIDWCEFDKLSH